MPAALPFELHAASLSLEGHAAIVEPFNVMLGTEICTCCLVGVRAQNPPCSLGKDAWASDGDDDDDVDFSFIHALMVSTT